MASSFWGQGRAPLRGFIVIALVLGGASAAFAYVAGWLSPNRLTAEKLVAALAPKQGPALGRRRNHVRGVCFSGVFRANGAGVDLSAAPMLAAGDYPVIGRFNVGTADPKAADATVRVRGMGLQISAPDGQVWRAALIDPPFFPVATPQAFYELLKASASGSPQAMKAFVAAHPEFARFGAWAQAAPWTGSFAEEPYNSLDSFVFTNAAGRHNVVRWSLLPLAQPVAISPGDLAKRAPHFLETEIAERVASSPQRWRMVVTLSAEGDPTDDPSQAWPESRRHVDVGELIVDGTEPEPNGRCRDINFDPTVLPDGIGVSDDPFPAARSAAYRESYDLRTGEEKFYPHSPESPKT